MAKILVIKFGALGDIAQTEGAIHDIRIHHKHDEITVLTTPGYERLFSRCPWIDDILIDHRHPWFHLSKLYALKRALHHGSYKRVYDLQQVDRSRIYYNLFFRGTEWMGDARGCTCYLRRPQDSCAADHYAKHLTRQGVRVNHTLKSDVSWMIEEVDVILKRKNVPQRFVALIAGGSSSHPQKRWSYFAELAERIMNIGQLPITIPGPDELELCHSIPGITLVDGENCLNIFQLAGVLSQAQFAIGNDTGPTHITAHLGRPGLALFGHHTSARSTGIQHTNFDWLETDDLRTLEMDSVWPLVEKLCRQSAKGGFRLCKELRLQQNRMP